MCYFYISSSGYLWRFAAAGPSKGIWWGPGTQAPQGAGLGLSLLGAEGWERPSYQRVYEKHLQVLRTLPAVLGSWDSHPPPPPSTRQCLRAAHTAPQGKPSPQLLLSEKKGLPSDHLGESLSKSKRALRNNSFTHRGSIYQLRRAEDQRTIPTLAAPTLLLEGRTKGQPSLLQTNAGSQHIPGATRASSSGVYFSLETPALADTGPRTECKHL